MEYGVCFDFDTNLVLCETNTDLVYFKPYIVTLVDIYYGKSSTTTVTESFVKSNFLTETGYVGSIDGRYYNFPTGYSYKYWCIPDLPNNSNRVIYNVTNGITNTVFAYDAYYQYYQNDPYASITYGKLSIDGTIYRVYRTITKTSSYNEQYVYSFT